MDTRASIHHHTSTIVILKIFKMIYFTWRTCSFSSSSSCLAYCITRGITLSTWSPNLCPACLQMAPRLDVGPGGGGAAGLAQQLHQHVDQLDVERLFSCWDRASTKLGWNWTRRPPNLDSRSPRMSRASNWTPTSSKSSCHGLAHKGSQGLGGQGQLVDHSLQPYGDVPQLLFISNHVVSKMIQL